VLQTAYPEFSVFVKPFIADICLKKAGVPLKQVRIPVEPAFMFVDNHFCPCYRCLMRHYARAILRASLILFMLLGMPAGGILSEAAEDSQRSTEILVAFIQNEWWLLRWSDNRPLCRVFTDHEGQPTPNEIQVYCGDTVLNTWQSTRPCTELDAKDPELAECSGLYLHFIGSEPAERTLHVTLPQPEVFLTLTGCDPVPLENRCMQLPYLTFSAREPLPNEYITAINGTIDNEPFSCPSEVCQVPSETHHHPGDPDRFLG
jgi:hypothetical protein